MPRQQEQTSSAVLRAFAILEQVVALDRPASMAEIISASGLPKPTVYRILVLLERAGLLLREPKGKRYTVGPRIITLAQDVFTNSTLRAPRHAILQALVEEIGETCNVTMLDGNEIVYLERVETNWPLRIHLQPGSRVPVHCTASGKLFLSQLPSRRRRNLITSTSLKRYTDKTLTDPKRLEQELTRIRAEKVGTDNEEWLAGMICLAVPVLDQRGRMRATVALHAPLARMTLEQSRRHLPALRRAAIVLSKAYLDNDQSSAGKPRRKAGAGRKITSI